MKIAILSRNVGLYSTRRIREAIRERDHQVVVIDYLRCLIDIDASSPKVHYQGHSIEGIDAIVPRIGASRTFYGTAVVRQFETMGVYTANGSQAIARSRDKLRSLQVLAQHGIPMPVTAFAHSPKDVAGTIDSVGGPPLVVKLLEGTQGIGVVLCETRKAAESVIEAFRGLEANILVQQFVKEAHGVDLRCLVVGDRVVATMLRRAAEGEFRANVHRGAVGEAIRPTPEERAVAVKASRAMGLVVSGVDILRSEQGPLVIEVNASPGLEGIETATGVDVAGKVVEHLEKHARRGSRRDRNRT